MAAFDQQVSFRDFSGSNSMNDLLNSVEALSAIIAEKKDEQLRWLGQLFRQVIATNQTNVAVDFYKRLPLFPHHEPIVKSIFSATVFFGTTPCYQKVLSVFLTLSEQGSFALPPPSFQIKYTTIIQKEFDESTEVTIAGGLEELHRRLDALYGEIHHWYVEAESSCIERLSEQRYQVIRSHFRDSLEVWQTVSRLSPEVFGALQNMGLKTLEGVLSTVFSKIDP